MKKAANLFAAALVCYLWLPLAHAAEPRPDFISVAYFQQWPVPAQYAKAKKSFDAALGLEVNWVASANGRQMSAEMATGEVQIAYSQGLVPFLVGVSGGLDLTMVAIAVSYPDNDNCIVHADSGISRSNATSLEGRRIAVRIGSVTHFRLLRVLDYLGIDAARIEFEAVADNAAALAALQQGDVAMACASGTTLRRMTALGQPLMSGAEQAAIGNLLFDIVSAPTRFVEAHPDLVQGFVDVIEAANQQWVKNPEQMRVEIARAADMSLAGSNRTLDRFEFPSNAEQASPAWMGAGVAAYLSELAEFFVAQGQLGSSLQSYERFIDTQFLR